MKSRRRSKRDKHIRLNKFCMSPATKVTIDRADGTQEVINVAPVVAPTDTEVDVQMSDGSTKKFVPAP